MRSRIRCFPLVLIAMLCGASPGLAQNTLTQQEALRLAFPAPAAIQRRTAYLDVRQLAAIKNIAGPGIAIEQRVVTYYVGVSGADVIGTAYFDAHRVRTLGEVVMVVVGPDTTVRRVEILKFLEPHEYRATEPWLRQFQGKRLSPGLALKRDIANMTGASITSRAITNAVRRALAIHQVIAAFSTEK